MSQRFAPILARLLTARERVPAIELPAPDLIDALRGRLGSTRQLTPARGAPELRIENAADEEQADVYIYDAIGFSWWDEGVTAKTFVQDFKAITAPRIVVHVNSPGGDVFDGIAIYNAIRDHGSEVTVRVEGIAASAASFIAMAGDRILMAPHSTMMIHDPWSGVVGNANDMRAEADVLDKLGNTIASIYSERASGPRGGNRGDTAHWRKQMLAESWYDDQEAVDAGLADAIDHAAPAAQNRHDLSAYRNVPEHLRAATEPADPDPLTERDAERALRDAGFSRRAARSIIARGWEDDDEREAPSTEPPPVEQTPPSDPETLTDEAAQAVAEAEAQIQAAQRAAAQRARHLALLAMR
jgi:ATP-dependent protease ClpP protease subunit